MSTEDGHIRPSRRLAAILAADIAGYSALMGADEARTVQDLKGHQAVVLPMIDQFGGRIIDTAGDGILAEFNSVSNAVECAVAIQDMMRARNAGTDAHRKMQYRIGINLGDVIYDDSRIYGDGINVAARLEGLAQPGGICISSKVYDVRGKMDLSFDDIGEQKLKNIAQSVRCYQVSGTKRTTSLLGDAKTLALPDKPSIAVLPFTNLSGDPDQDYFGDGIAEDILTDLAKLRWLFVIARNSSFTFRGKIVDVRNVSRELGVRYVLEGSVRRAGNRVRVTGQLIDATTGSHVWASRYDRDLLDIFAVQDEITAAIAAAIRPAIIDAEQRRALHKSPERLDAWEAYHRGMWHFSMGNRESSAIAKDFFQKSVDMDPNFAAAARFGDAARKTGSRGNGRIASLPTGFLNLETSIPGHTCVSPSNTQGKNRMPELGPSGSLRGAASNHRPYRDLITDRVTPAYTAHLGVRRLGLESRRRFRCGISVQRADR